MSLQLIPKVPMEEWAIKPSPKDPRDYMYSLKVANPYASTDRPRRFINKRHTVRNQGNKGACGGFSGANAKDKREGIITSPLYLYQMAKAIDNIQGEGTDMRSLMTVLKTWGICREDLHPWSSYSNNVPLQFPTISKEAHADAITRVIEAYARTMIIEEMLDAIWKYGSVMAGQLVASNFYEPERSKDGQSYVDIPGGYVQGGHAVDYAGYDMDMTYTYKSGVTRKGFVLVDNSWGEDWGSVKNGEDEIKGSAWQPFDYVFGKQIDIALDYVMDMFAPIDIMPWRKEIKTLDEVPHRQGSRIFVPTRAIGEGLGAQVNWDQKEPDKVEFVLDNKKVEVWVGRKEYNVYTKTS